MRLIVDWPLPPIRHPSLGPVPTSPPPVTPHLPPHPFPVTWKAPRRPQPSRKGAALKKAGHSSSAATTAPHSPSVYASRTYQRASG